MKKNMKIVAALMAIGLVSPAAYATNGMNLEGYGPIAAAMGGASQAYDNGTAAVMNNPATLGLMPEGTRIDVAVGILAPDVTAKMTGQTAAKSSADLFIMPAMGFATKSGSLTYGAGLFAQGGMGTEYSATSFMAAGSGEKVRSEVGVMRVIVPLAYQLDEKITIAGSLDYVRASMDIKMALSGGQFGDMVAGLGGSQAAGSASGSMVNTLVGGFTVPQAMCGAVPCLSTMQWARLDFSDDNAFTGKAQGAGMAGKLGATYKYSQALTLGMSYHSKTALGDLEANDASMSMNVTGPATLNAPTTIVVTGKVKVKNFQWPETYAIGGAYQVNDQLMLVADYKYIGWKAVMKDFNVTFTADATQTGAAGPGGFNLGGQVVDMTLKQNWDDQNVIQIGGAYKTSPDLTLRAGLNYANNPVPDKYMNPLFPAIATTNVTVGAGYNFSKVSSVDFNYAYVPKITGGIAATGATVDFAGYSAQLMYSHRI